MTDSRCYRNGTGVDGQAIYTINDPYICPGTESAQGNARCCESSGICLGHSICQSLNPPANGTGYYISSCTDRDFEDREVCPNACSSLRVPEIVYNKTEGTWYCCGLSSDGSLRCHNPTTQTVAAPSPAALLRQYSASSLSFMSTASMTSLPAAPTDTGGTPVSTESNSGASQGLSTGAQAGIGVGVAVAAIAIFALIWFLLRSCRKKRMSQAGLGMKPWPYQSGYNVINTGGTMPPEVSLPVRQNQYNGGLETEPTNFAAHGPGPVHTRPAPVELSPQERTAAELMSSTRKNPTLQELPT